MTNPLYKYHENNGDPVVVKEPEMDKPDTKDYQYISISDKTGMRKKNFRNGKYTEDVLNYEQYLRSLPRIFAHALKGLFADGQTVEEGKDFVIEYQCPACGGDGKETCNNPDHRFIDSMPGDTGRLGCPVCGHDPKYKVNRGRNTCPECGGLGTVHPDLFEEYRRETGYDEEPVPCAIPASRRLVALPVEEGKEVKDKEGETIIAAMALVRTGWQMACDHLLTWCNDKKLSPEFIDNLFLMMDKEKKQQFNWETLRKEFEILGHPEMMPPKPKNEQP